MIAGVLALHSFAGQPVAADGLAVDDAYSVAEDADLAVTADIGVLVNDTGGTLALCVSSFDTTGLVGSLGDPPSLAPDGSFLYTPPPNFNGATTFTYAVATKAAEVCPPVGEGSATVTITVTPVNDPPSAVADSFTALAGRTLNVAAPGVLGNDSDVDGDPLTAIKTSSPSHGEVTLAPDGGFSYTPAAGYVGHDAFAYRASDGTDQSLQRVVGIDVVAVPPTLSPTPVPAPTPVPPTASPEPSATESPEPSDSGFASVPPFETGPIPSASPSAGPVAGPISSEGGPPILAIGALVLLLGLLGVAAVYFVRSQQGGEEAFERSSPGEDVEDVGDGKDGPWPLD